MANYYVKELESVTPNLDRLPRADERWKIQVRNESGEQTHWLSVPFHVIAALGYSLATLED